ncbi:MAG: hypothetical protein HKN43_06580 [Rhodothermales bacterium]|nr:hypothetical protein [Rhodothermales bacterium]
MKGSTVKRLPRHTFALQWIVLLLISVIISSTWAATVPMPVVTGDQLNWPVVGAKTINVHSGDGAYVESLPGSATSWTAPAPGDYFLVAASNDHWSSWPKSETVTVGVSSAVPMPVVSGDQLNWPLVSAKTINVHTGKGAYVESLPGSATSWTAPAPGDYFLVAASSYHWSSWPKSEMVTVGVSSAVPMPVVSGDQLNWPVVTAKTINVHRGDGAYVESLPGSATSWTAPAPGDYYLVAASSDHWSSWPKSETVTVSGGDITTPEVIVTEIQKLLASDGVQFDRFGNSVAVDGDTAVIGAHLKDDGKGSAYVFVRSGGTWREQARLTPGDSAAGSSFGRSVSISGDTAVIGAYESAYVFVRSGNTWNEQAMLTGNDGNDGNDGVGSSFGEAVFVAGDTAVIGAWLDDDAGYGSGSAYVFVRSGVTWSEQVKLTASDGAEYDLFGQSVSISGDTAVIGAQGRSASMFDDPSISSGSAYVFVRNGTIWSEQARLTASDAANFGNSVSVAGDTAIIGAVRNVNDGLGSAYVFVRDGTNWSEQARLTASDAVKYDYFGHSVTISGDSAVIGAPLYGYSVGAAYVFVRSGITWNEQAKLTASDALNVNHFGNSVSVAGNTVIIGAEGDARFTGSAYVFDLETDTDGDGTPDNEDNCPNDYNFDQADFDDDGIGYACDAEDGLSMD